MALFTTLVDDFNDGSLAAVWSPNTYGGVTETGGRARIPCIVGDYAGLQTAKSFNINNSSVFGELVTLPALGGGAVNLAFFVTQATAGTSIGFELDISTNTLRCVSNTAYWDAAATVLTFSHATHRWFRLRADGTNVYWDTSADGTSWTNRRTLAKPAWVGTTADAQALDVWCNRVGGTTDYAEWDNINVAPATGTDWVNNFSDSEGLTDSLSLGQGHSVTQSDSEGLTDDLSLVQGGGENPADTEGLTDSIAFVQTEIDSYGDSLGLTDSLFLDLGQPYVGSDTLGLTDSLAFTNIYGEGPSDSLGLSDSLELSGGSVAPLQPVQVGMEGSLVLGPAALYIAAFGALEPTNGNVANPPDSGVWTDLGGTLGGVELTVDQEWIEVELKQLPDKPMKRLKRRRLSIKTQLAETSLANLAYALNDTTAVTGTAFEPSVRSEASVLSYNALIVDGWKPGFNVGGQHKRRRLIIRKCLSVDNVQLAYKKDGQSVYTVTWTCHYVDSVTPPFRVIDEA